MNRFRKMIIVGLLMSSNLGFAADEVRNGGDHVRITFNEGLYRAINNVKNANFESSTPFGSASALLWLHENQMKLAAELETSEVRWVERLPENCSNHTCACTGLTPKSAIYLSLKQCSIRFVDSEYAAKLLVHEAVHHFGVTDESLADEIAVLSMKPHGEPMKRYASLGLPVTKREATNQDVSAPSEKHSLSLLTQSRNLLKPFSGVGLQYGYSFSEKWAVTSNYVYSKLSNDDISSMYSIGLKYLINRRKIQSFGLVSVNYEKVTSSETYKNDENNASSTVNDGTRDLGVGIGLQYFIKETSKVIFETERGIAGVRSYSNKVYIPYAKWQLRLGVGVAL